MTDHSPSLADTLLAAASRLETAAHHLFPVETMEAPAREEAVALARDILERLKHLSDNSENVQARTAEQAAQAANQAESVAILAAQYEARWNQLVVQDPRSANHEIFQIANRAVAEANYVVLEQAVQQLLIEGREDEARAVAERLSAMPAAWKNPKRKSLQQLSQEIEAGLLAMQKQVEGNVRARQQEEFTPDERMIDPLPALPGADALAAISAGKKLKNPAHLLLEDEYFRLLQQKREQKKEGKKAGDLEFQAGASIKAASVTISRHISKKTEMAHQMHQLETMDEKQLAEQQQKQWQQNRQDPQQPRQSGNAALAEQQSLEEQQRQQREVRRAQKQQQREAKKAERQQQREQKATRRNAKAMQPAKEAKTSDLSSLLKQSGVNLGSLGVAVDHATHDSGRLKPNELPEKQADPNRNR